MQQDVLLRNFAKMWKAWLAQTDNSVVVEAMDASQDARLRLILAALILLFGIAVTLIMLALSRSRTSKVAQQVQNTKAVPQKSQLTAPPEPPSKTEEKTHQASAPRVTARESKSASAVPAKSTEKSSLSVPKPERSATVSSSNTSATLSTKEPRPIAPPSGQPGRPESVPARPASSSALPLAEPRTSRSFNPEEYKKELAQMNPEKKRQEILQRLAEIQSDKKNAESRAAVRLPSVTAAPRPLPSPKPEPAPMAVSKSSETQPPQQTSPPASFQPVQTPEVARPSEIRPITPEPPARDVPPINTEALVADSKKPVSLPEESGSFQASEKRLQNLRETEDFSTLSSIQRKLTNPPPRLAFRDWLRKIEREG